MSAHMISCLSWVPKGAPKSKPDLYDMDEAGMTDFNKNFEDGMKIDNGMDEEGLGSDLEEGDQEEDILKALDMDNYDNEDGDGGMLVEEGVEAVVDDDYQDDEDEEHQYIDPTHSCILVGNTSEDDSAVEVYVYDEKSSNLYVHHDFKLNSFPLCVQWVGVDLKNSTNAESVVAGSYAAVGTFNPAIELWNCDIMNPMAPTFVLGGYDDEAMVRQEEEWKAKQKKVVVSKKPVKGAKKTAKFVPTPVFLADSHQDAVMCLSWNANAKHLLASGSADNTVKIWDTTTRACMLTLDYHTDKVQAVEWNPVEHYILLSGSYDGTVRVCDIRTPQNTQVVKVQSEIESIKWIPTMPFMFVVATENGFITCYDVRDLSKAVWIIQAHQKSTTCITFHNVISTLFATASIDERIKVWDTRSGVPELVAERHLDIGKLFCLAFDKSSPFILACGGDGGALGIWDIMENYKVNALYLEDAKKLQLGDHALPEEYIELQKQGIQGKGLGPGKEGNNKNRVHLDDSESDSDDEGQRAIIQDYKPYNEDGEDMDDEDMEDEDEE